MSDADRISDLKRETRNAARDVRRSIDEERAAEAARALGDRLCELDAVKGARVVLAYAATPDEIDPAPAVALLRSRGAAIAFPRIEAPGTLGIHLVEADDDLVPGPYGIREPDPDTPRIELTRVDAVFVPGVAFDEQCYRLGYGGGYYDRLVPLLRQDCIRIGLAYEEQVVEEIPCEEHDVRMDVVVTPTRAVVPPGPGGGRDDALESGSAPSPRR